MTQKELIERIATKMGTTQKQVGDFISNLTSEISEGLKNEGKVQIQSLGIFEVKERAARTAKVPGTGKIVEGPAKKVPVFKASKHLKEVLL